MSHRFLLPAPATSVLPAWAVPGYLQESLFSLLNTSSCEAVLPLSHLLEENGGRWRPLVPVPQLVTLNPFFSRKFLLFYDAPKWSCMCTAATVS